MAKEEKTSRMKRKVYEKQLRKLQVASGRGLRSIAAMEAKPDGHRVIPTLVRLLAGPRPDAQGYLFKAWHIVRSDDKKRARLNCISHLLELIPHKRISRDKVKLPKRSKKDQYNDQASLEGMSFVVERHELGGALSGVLTMKVLSVEEAVALIPNGPAS